VRQAEQIANRIQESLVQSFTLESHEVFMTASIGIAMITSEYASPEDVLRDADSAMYRAKAAGRACFELFDANMYADNLTLLRLEADLRRAIDRQEFRVVYQPIIALRTGEVVGAEALLRWQHPERGLISPVEFITLAEDTGMILPIGEWVLATACDEMQSLRENGLPDLYVSVNISARQVQSQDLPALVQSVLGQTGLPGRCLSLEITENAVMADVAQSAQVLNELKALDVEIAVDDFGTSYSSLNYLKRFPVDVIKIDRSFILECANDPDDAAISSAIIAMGHILGMRIIAEGVETTDQMAFLHAHQCDFVQGFLVSHPIPLDQLCDLLLCKQGIPQI
jgi:EAL domain-containing protein (putative c-di-GMP-specific phosphodiesterase class I)